MISIEDRCKEMIGENIVVRDKDYGVVESFYSITESGHTRYIFETDAGKKVEAASYFNYLIHAGKQVIYPQGSDYSKRVFGPKAKSYNIRYVPTGNLPNIAHSNYKGENKRGGN